MKVFINNNPHKRCAEVALEALLDGRCSNMDIVMCAYSEEDYDLFVEIYENVKSRT